MTTQVGPEHLAEVVFVMFPYCTCTLFFPFFHSVLSLEGSHCMQFVPMDWRVLLYLPEGGIST